MNRTISIYLSPTDTGSHAQTIISCQLYKGSYKDKQIEVYVPTSIQYNVVGDNILNTVSLAGDLVSEQGIHTTTIPYYPNFVQNEIVNGVEYAVYSLDMPNTFTAFVGTQTIDINVVSIDNTDPTSPVVLEVVTTQQTTLTINPSANISQEETIDADVVAQLEGQIQDLQANVALKQNITDATLQTTNKTVPTAINEVNEQAQSNASSIQTQSTAITNLQNDVAELQGKIVGAEIPVGSMTGTTLPTNAQLTAYTVQQTGNQPQPNNVIIFTLEVEGGTDRVFKYIYVSAEDGWMSYEIPALEHASNGTFGSLQGTYAINSTNNVLVDIQNGEIVDIYYKDSDGAYQNIQSSINLLSGTQDAIIDGTQQVGLATKAIQDQLGNVINTTYIEADDVYTKTESDDRYLPKTYTNIYYYSQNGLVDDVPTTPASGIQFSQTVNSLGETLIGSASRTTTTSYHFTKNSTDSSSIVIATDVDCSLQFKLVTQIQYQDTHPLTGAPITTIRTIATDLTDLLQFSANTPKTIAITSIYSDLGTTEMDVAVGSVISKTLYAISTTTDAITVDLYSNSTYPSTYQLNAQSIIFNVNTINGLKSVNIAQSEWTDNGDGTYTVTVPQTTHQQPASTKYILELQKQVTANSYQYIAFTPIVSDDGNITITTNEAIDCVLLIGSNLASDERGIMNITNPTAAQEINYNLFGAMKVTQTSTPTSLSLLAPQDAGKFYTFYITNDANSTENIIWNNETIEPGVGTQFKWNGSAWMVGEQPSATDEVYDKDRDQLLSTTLADLQSSINTNANGITTLTNSKANATLSNVTTASLNSVLPATNIDTWGTVTLEAENYYTTADIPYQKAVVVFDLTAQQPATIITVENANNVKEVRLKAIKPSGTNYYNINVSAGNNTTLNGATETIDLWGANDGDLGTLYYAGSTNGVTSWMFEPAKHDDTVYCKGTNLSVPANTITPAPYSQVVASGWTNLFAYGQNNGARLSIAAPNSSAKVVKFYLDFNGQTAPRDGAVTISFGSTVVGTKTFQHNDTMTPFAAAIVINQNEGAFNITSTFATTVDWQVCAMDIDLQKSSPINNQFDIATGTRWDIDYTNKTITLKE